MRASISKPTPFIYLAFEKTDPFIYLIIQNVDLFIYCPLIFCTHFLLVITQISQSVHIIPRGYAASKKSLNEKYVHIPGCQKNGAFHIGIKKNRAIHVLFVEKRGPIIYLAALKKGAIRHAPPPHPTKNGPLANHIPGSAEKGGYSARTPPPPPPPTHTHTKNGPSGYSLSEVFSFHCHRQQ